MDATDRSMQNKMSTAPSLMRCPEPVIFILKAQGFILERLALLQMCDSNCLWFQASCDTHQNHSLTHE